ncbi:MAG: hypothetical protein QNJ63_17510 [Calothrix sp. MO_192.B10]|nr:hypothetical protein [Calothrix sp. MO_192.B10]
MKELNRQLSTNNQQPTTTNHHLITLQLYIDSTEISGSDNIPV